MIDQSARPEDHDRHNEQRDPRDDSPSERGEALSNRKMKRGQYREWLDQYRGREHQTRPRIVGFVGIDDRPNDQRERREIYLAVIEIVVDESK